MDCLVFNLEHYRGPLHNELLLTQHLLQEHHKTPSLPNQGISIATSGQKNKMLRGWGFVPV